MYADGPPIATGVVTCTENYPGEFNVATIKNSYPIELFSLGGLVEDRWGPDRDVSYGAFPGEISGLDNRNFSWYLNSVSDPSNPETFEMLYSETGKLDVKVKRNGEMKITGKSFAAMDTHWDTACDPTCDWVQLSAECEWKLSGFFPGF